MSLFPALRLPPLVTITPFSLESAGVEWVAKGISLSGATSATWPAANRALFYPFTLSEPVIAVKLFVLNGATASGNIDAGIYDRTGNRIVSTGSTAQSGTSVIQEFDITDTLFGPGTFYLALVMNNTTGTTFRQTTSSGSFASTGACQMASAFPLPATATFANTWHAPPVFGLTTRSVI